MTRPEEQQSLLQWLSHAYSGVKRGNLEQLRLTIFLRFGVEANESFIDVQYWRALDIALSLNSVPDLRWVHVRLEAGRYNRDAMSVLLRVRDSIRSACKGLEERYLLSFELDAGM
ncbi:hypothetical protein BDZ89DRAFT_1055898 [Hymenopellis radicata]|nr:hypothetical protein BDZ89DRAFT_1055898 [Hymenopellis radicata]